ELDRIITRLLSKDPQARATNAMVVAKQLSAMEHALSLPPTAVGQRLEVEAEADEVTSDMENSAAATPAEAASPQPPGRHDDFSIANAHTLADPRHGDQPDHSMHDVLS